MREIGGYIELDKYTLPMLHENAIALNCGRNALAYLIRARKIKNILIPKFLCDSVIKVCNREQIKVSFYSITTNFMPCDIKLEDDQWIYIVNYYGQIDNKKIEALSKKYERVIIDNVQAYFQMPVNGIDTIYTCRKFFGVSDGAFLYTNANLQENLEQDESFNRMRFLLGRFERSASEFYSEYAANNDMFENEPIKYMSKLTNNLLHGIEYESIRRQRVENFTILHEAFQNVNELELVVPDGAFMYPLYIENGATVRKELQKKKIYIPTLWPDVFEWCEDTEIECNMAQNILPLPVDQRYIKEDMQYIINEIEKCRR